MIVHYDNAIMTIKVCTLAASSARYYDIELSVLLNLTYFVLSSLAQVRDLSLIAMFKSQQRTKTHGIAASLSALLERGEPSVISGP